MTTKTMSTLVMKGKCSHRLNNGKFLGSCRHQVVALSYVPVAFIAFCSLPYYVLMNTRNVSDNSFLDHLTFINIGRTELILKEITKLIF